LEVIKIRIPLELKSQLQARAREAGRPVAEEVRRAIIARLDPAGEVGRQEVAAEAIAELAEQVAAERDHRAHTERAILRLLAGTFYFSRLSVPPDRQPDRQAYEEALRSIVSRALELEAEK